MNRYKPTWEPPPYEPAPVELPENAMDVMFQLREFAAMVWGEICGLFGASNDLVRDVTQPRQFVRQARDWVSNLEMLMKRIIIILALSLQLTPVRPHKPRPGRADKDSSRIRRSHWRQPETWKVSFRMMPPRKRERERDEVVRPPPAPLTHFVRTYGLARRIETLRRVVSNTKPFAVRFARTLARFKARNDRANAKTVLAPRPWDFHPHLSSVGEFGVHDGMVLAHPLAARSLRIWQQDLLAPG